MRFKHILGPLCAASISVVLAGHALAQDKIVKIGALYPMSGNSASVGVHAKAAIETAVDIINNAHPELGDFPLARNAGQREIRSEEHTSELHSPDHLRCRL